MQRIINSCLVVFIVITAYNNVSAQSGPYLERKVSVVATNEQLVTVFNKISSQAGVAFSYNPKQFNDSRRVNVNHTSISLRLLLDELLKGTNCHYKIKKNYIIIYSIGTQNQLRHIKGYVYSSADSSIITDVSIYNVQDKKAVLSNTYGYFTISSSKPDVPMTLSIAKENYTDTSITLTTIPQKNIVVYISPKKITAIQPDTFDSAVLRDIAILKNSIVYEEEVKKKNDFISSWLKKRSQPNLRNIKDTLYTDFSVSLVPFLSTNKLLSINTQNKFSFNILAGQSKGVKYAELGGLLNIDNGNVGYAQVGGLGNVVSGDVRGVQIGGIFNIVQKNTHGVQIGGIFNHNTQSTKGIQIAGIYNVSDSVKGVQIAGLINKARYTAGAQVSGIVNRARVMKGFQLALINLSDTCKGVPIGLFSFVKRGYHKLEIASNESRLATIGFRTGVEYLHNIFFAGADISQNPTYFTYGYGLGSSFKLSKRFYLGVDLTSQQIQPKEGQDIYLSLLNKAQLNIEFMLLKKLRIAVGPSFNIMVADHQSRYYSAITGFFVPQPFSAQTDSYSSVSTRMWIGAGASIKLF